MSLVTSDPLTFECLWIGWNLVDDIFTETPRIGIIADKDAVVNSVNTVNTQTASTHC